MVSTDILVVEGLGSDGDAHHIHILLETGRDTQRLQATDSTSLTNARISETTVVPSYRDCYGRFAL